MGTCVRKGFYKLCRATQAGDAEDSFVDGAHRQTTQAAPRHLIGRLPGLANMETDISKRLLLHRARSPPFRALQPFKGKASDKGESKFQMFRFILAPENFVCVGETARQVLCGRVRPPPGGL